jgi:hypothetical protein
VSVCLYQWVTTSTDIGRPQKQDGGRPNESFCIAGLVTDAQVDSNKLIYNSEAEPYSQKSNVTDALLTL